MLNDDRTHPNGAFVTTMRPLERYFLRCQKPKSLLFIFSVIVTLSFWSILPAGYRTNESSDYVDFYEPVARNIFNGNGLSGIDGSLAMDYPPGYPFLLAGTFAIARFLKIPEGIVLSTFTLVCMGTASVFVFTLANIIWSRFLALISALLWMTCPIVLWVAKQPNSEAPFLVFFYAGFLLFLHSVLHKKRGLSPYFFSGVLIGLSMLVRPIAIGAVLVMGAAYYVVAEEKKPGFRLLFVAAMLFGNLIAISPWEAWVYSQTNKFVPLSTGGSSSIRDGLTFAVVQKDYRQTIRLPTDVVELMEDIHATSIGSPPNNSSESIMSVIVEKFLAQPLALARLYGIKAARSWYATDSGRFETAIISFQIPYLLLIVLGSVAAWNRRGIFRDSTIVIWLMVLYFWAMTTTVLSIVRYMVPAVGLLFVLAPGVVARYYRFPRSCPR